ncbi:hypothetical protein SAY86_006470 [Trapa natans]|uniref:Brix domain-containing protein n=1 Tax=Trapa natans TaxID=22666 RepID=A0AAN7LE49_TRANT|nr:hypothetical protein SAY86_006470 [Trapa natans]
MGKKRKQRDTEQTQPEIKRGEDAAAPERPKRPLLGWKEKPQEDDNTVSPSFRNKEKNMLMVLIAPGFSAGSTRIYLYLWMEKCPNGPSVKFLVNAVHTMEELKLTGNHLRGSRPILTFSSNFDNHAHWKLLKEMIIQIFGTPKGHHKSKPYYDHVFVFSIVDDHIWFRNYQISVPHRESDKVSRGSLEKMTLVEVGPRFCMNPIKIFGGSFGGPTLYENPFYVSPNQIRALEKKQKVNTFAKKVKAKARRMMHELSNPLEADEFADVERMSSFQPAVLLPG